MSEEAKTAAAAVIRAIPESEASPALSDFPERGNRWYILCPGCYAYYKERYPDDDRFWLNGAIHCFSTKVHGFNGDREKPTLSPSLLCQWTRSDTNERYCCHSFVKDGRIQFLGDCTHPLKGQTVDLMDCAPLLERAKRFKEKTDDEQI